jgi:hypothetical protein
MMDISIGTTKCRTITEPISELIDATAIVNAILETNSAKSAVLSAAPLRTVLVIRECNESG